MSGTYYLAGPMTGHYKFNIPSFERAAWRLRTQGYTVISPVELDDPVTHASLLSSRDGALTDDRPSYGWSLGRDIETILDSDIDGVFVLPGWERSRGARLETFVARKILNVPVYYYDTRKEVPAWRLLRAWLLGR